MKERIIEINNILLADQKARDEAYNKAITLADNYATSNELRKALKEYENASNIKSNEQYPKKKISEIQAIFKEQERLLREKYNKEVSYQKEYTEKKKLKRYIKRLEFQRKHKKLAGFANVAGAVGTAAGKGIVRMAEAQRQQEAADRAKAQARAKQVMNPKKKRSSSKSVQRRPTQNNSFSLW